MNNELQRLIEKWKKSGEGLRLDLKESPILENRKAIAKHFVAFANRQGGKLVIGVEDTGEIEGSTIDEEKSKDVVSDAANDICGPPVSVTTQFLPEQSEGGSSGDVLIINIPSSSVKPHAVVSGKNRAYYVRTTNQSRPVRDSQGVQQLYLRSSTTVSDFLGEITVNYDKTDLELTEIEPFPEIYQNLYPYFSNLSSEDKDYLREDKRRIAYYYAEVLPFAILRSVGNSPDFWIGYADDSYDDELVLHVLYSNCEETHFDEVVNYDLEYEKQNVEMIRRPEFPSSSDYINIDGVMQELSINPVKITNIGSIVIPSGTEIYVTHLNPAVPTRITISKGDVFSLEIQSGTTFLEETDGLPESHPYNGLLNYEHQISALSGTVATENTLAFPGNPDPNIVQNTAFIEGWIEHLRSKWDWERFTEEDTDSLLRLDKRLDILENKLDMMIQDEN